MLLDLHNHTRYSPDSRVSPADLVAAAKRIGLGGLAITDHNAVGGVKEAQEAAGEAFLVIPGIEVSTASGHVLGYGVREVVPRDLSVAESVERIVALGGVAVAAHPFRFWSGLGGDALGQEIIYPGPFGAKQQVADRIREDTIDLLRHRPVEAPQPRLHVHKFDAQLDGDQPTGNGAVDIAYHKDVIGPETFHNRLETPHYLRSLHRMAA